MFNVYLRLRLGVHDADDLDLDVAVAAEPVLLDLDLGRVWKNSFADEISVNIFKPLYVMSLNQQDKKTICPYWLYVPYKGVPETHQVEKTRCIY